MDRKSSRNILIGFIWLFFSAEVIACNVAPSAVICAPETKYVEPGPTRIDASCSSDPDGSIQKYEWDYDYSGPPFVSNYYETPSYHPDGSFDGKHYVYYSAGTHTTRVRVTDNGGLTGEDQCTVHAVTLEVDVPASYPAWVHVGHSLALGCTVTPSDLGGSYHWSQEIGPGTMTFSPSESDDDPSFSADKRGVYRADVEYTIGDLTLTDGTHNMYVVEVELFREPSYQQRLNDWPEEGSLPRSVKYLFGKNDAIYVKVDHYAPDSDTREFYEEAVKVSNGSDVVYLDVNEGPADNYVICTNKWANDELLFLDESTLDDPDANDRIEVEDEDVLTFYLEVPPQSGTYVESNSVMIDRAEVGVEWQSNYDTYDTYPTLNYADECAEGFYNNLGTANFTWWQNFDNGDLNSEETHWDEAVDWGYADSVDFALWCGHGTASTETPRALRFFVDWDPFGMKMLPDKLTWSEVDWGDQDVEWVVLNTCCFMKGTASELKVMAEGVHLICGYETDMTVFDVAGQWFADKLDEMNITSAWHNQCWKYQPSGNTSRVLGTSSTMADSLGYSGPIAISRDPTASSTYVLDDYTKP